MRLAILLLLLAFACSGAEPVKKEQVRIVYFMEDASCDVVVDVPGRKDATLIATFKSFDDAAAFAKFIVAKKLTAAQAIELAQRPAKK